MLAALVYKGRDIKEFVRMIEDVFGNGSGRLAEHIGEHIIQLEIGDGQTVLGAVLLPGQAVGEFSAVAHQVAKLTDVRRRDKAGLDHVAHE